jgi:hypothetical protein
MDTSPTLQDFVVKLLTDPGARSAFELDPQGVLADAGLGDLTAADVREVVPLLADYAPVHSVPVHLDFTDPAGMQVGSAATLYGGTTALYGDLRYPSAHGLPDFGAGVTVATAAGATVGLGSLHGNSLSVSGLGFGLGWDGPDLPAVPEPGAVVDTGSIHDGVAPVLGGAADPVLGGVDSVTAGHLPQVPGGALNPTLDPALGGVADPVVGAVDPLLGGGAPGTHDLFGSGLRTPALPGTDSGPLGGIVDHHPTSTLVPDLAHTGIVDLPF